MNNQITITNSEWIILRVLLTNSPLGSGEIASILKEEYNWSNTTVKTFLSRLVSKKVIAYHTEKNAFRYFPLVTEMDYVRNETKSFYSNLYGGSVIYETEHFQFSGAGSKDFMIKLAALLEDNFDRITKDFAYSQKRKQSVYIHSSLKLLHSALGFEKGPDWMTAGWSWEIIHIAPEEAFSEGASARAALHVYSQLLMKYLNPNAPFWLVQGISVYEANWLTYDQIKKAITIEFSQLDEFSVYRVPTNLYLFEKQRGFEITYTVIEYIVAIYGKEAMLQFLKTPENLRSIFKLSEHDFWNSWKESIRTRYIDNE